MGGSTAPRWILSLAAVGLWLGLSAPPAQAFEFLDGRLQVHGYFETQIRGIARDFQASDNWDLTQWWNILSIEIEADIAPDGFGPFDAVSAYSRIEVRYDCVYTRACGIFESANTYGDRPKRLPKRLGDGRRTGFTGNLFTGNIKHYMTNPRDKQAQSDRFFPDDSRKAGLGQNTSTFSPFFGVAGPDAILGNGDDPAPFYFSRFFNEADGVNHCRWANRKVKGPTDGIGDQELGPFDFACKVRPFGPMADKPNPFRAGDFSPITGGGGIAELPYRPAPDVDFDSKNSIDRGQAKGVWIPNAGLAKLMRDGEFDNIDQNFRQEELAWNRGASQQDEKELKELYFDIEMFDSRLFMRIGRQTIIWGKTELFAIDPFNPRDLALASLPSLEESRIALWAFRAIFSLYEVGPLEDVRIEAALDLDQFEPNDFGRCGEPYTALAACNITFGNFVHGYTGLGLAGTNKPPHPWNDTKGLQGGMRMEFRYDRFSFALTDYYGYQHSFWTDQVFQYSRNVDPKSGRPRHTTATGVCKTGREPACLDSDDALERHSVNQQLFAMICATSIGFSALDTSACGQSVFNSQVNPNPLVTIAQALDVILAGDGTNPVQGSTGAILNALVPGIPFDPLVHLTNNGPAAGITVAEQFGLNRRLTTQQQALLGCGLFYETDCDIQGIDLMNVEFSAVAQSWAGFEGTSGNWNTTDGSVDQPGTTGFRGGPVCTRYVNGRTLILPGCRGPGDEGYDPAIDGLVPNGAFAFPAGTAAAQFTGNRGHPFTGQAWRSEMAALSFNAMMALVVFSAPGAEGIVEDVFDVANPFREGACSFANPQFCGSFQSFLLLGRVQRNTIEAGGNGRFGRRDFVWSMGTPLIARYEKRNILGVSTDFAEDVSKTNWGIEFNWEEGIPQNDSNQVDGISKVDTYNLTVSVDRPTFINFLNQGRTFFFNSQWFFQYIKGYEQGFQGSGPFNMLATFTVQTGYFQDRLLPSFTFVYDFRSNSGAFLPQITYRFTEDFSATFGVAGFWGREVAKDTGITQTAGTNRVGQHAYKNFTEPALTVVRERDEVFLRVRYTF